MLSRITLVYLFLLAMLAGCSSSGKAVSEKAAQENTAPENAAPDGTAAEKAATKAALKKHMLWQISDSNSSVYLLGSVHFADSTFYPLDTAITNAFDNSTELAVELDMTDTAVYMAIAKQSELRGKLPAGQSLAQILPGDVKKLLDSLCQAWYIAPEVLYGFKPWSAAMTISSLAIMRLGFDPNLGIDFYFLNSAIENQKKIVSLESVEDQVAVLVGEGIPDSLAFYYLKSSITEMQLMDSSITQMMRAWRTGDESLFREAMYMEAEGEVKDSLMDAAIEDLVYISRNRNMADSIASFLAQDRKVFIVVGAAHMAGKGDNVLKLLRDKGMTIEQH